MKFSEVVADAKAKGYTEPDPRDDLSGEAARPRFAFGGSFCAADGLA